MGTEVEFRLPERYQQGETERQLIGFKKWPLPVEFRIVFDSLLEKVQLQEGPEA